MDIPTVVVAQQRRILSFLRSIAKPCETVIQGENFNAQGDLPRSLNLERSSILGGPFDLRFIKRSFQLRTGLASRSVSAVNRRCDIALIDEPRTFR